MNLLLRRTASMLGILAILLGSFTWAAPARPVLAAPTSVTIAGSLDTALGCGGDWDPACAAAHLAYDASDDVWQNTWTVPAGNWEYKAALNDSWTENYGLHAAPGGANIPLNLGTDATVKFYYDDKTHWVTDNVSSVIVTAPGSYQSELGCSGDWDPGCLRSWLEDPDGDGTYTFETTALPAGSYEAKATINESWDENYGQGGVPNGPNIAFTVPVSNAKVTFTYNATTHVLTILAGHSHDGNVEWDGLRHDSRDLLYRTPGGAVPAGTPVKIRFRTFHDDVTSVSLRLYDINAAGQQILPMQVAASNVSCYQAGLENERCDFYEATLDNPVPNNFWYRFIVNDGSKTVFYADNTQALDGGLGAPSDSIVDNSYALMVYQPDFTTPAWMKNAVIYQIFPDRFRSGNPTNDPKTGQTRYDLPAIKLPWGTLPEGYCRDYAGADATTCPWRFGVPPGVTSATEQPEGRDYFGGDLKGVSQQMDYLQSLGVTVIYFNPIFDARSNHRYDTADYLKIDPNLGTLKDFQDLVKLAKNHGIKVVLDGVFNHMSSDSPFFDRYHHSSTVGACESPTSAYRSWFVFHDVTPGTGQCVDSNGTADAATYDGWFGFDSIPVLNKSNPAVQSYFLTGTNNVTSYWLKQGASGWRLDVMGDASFPNGYWETFRSTDKKANPQSVIIGELWQKDSTLLRFLRGDRADTTMNYRLRDAVVGLLAPNASFDSKGFADSGHPLKPSEFAARISSIREDYPDAAYYTLMNLLDSHDTERLRWTLTPGDANTANREQNAANAAAGKQRVKIASLIQYTMPGAPTVYYGDEVGMTGATDPDDRRTYPWTDKGGTIDTDMLTHYQTLASVRKASPALVNGDLRILLVNDSPSDATGVVVYGRKTGSAASLIAVNTSSTEQTVNVPVAGYLPDGIPLNGVYAANSSYAISKLVAGGEVQGLTLAPLSALILSSGTVDLTPPAAPKSLAVTNEGNEQVSLAWQAVSGAAGYNVYRSPLSGGGYVKVNDSPLGGTTYTDTGLANATQYYYTARAIDQAGNESGPSNEVSAMPHLVIGWANLQWPPTMTHTISAINRTDTAYGQVWIDGVTSQPGLTPTLRAQLGFGPAGSNPSGNAAWTWVEASFNVDTNNNDEFMASMLPSQTGTFDYLYRYTTTNGREWLYADLNGPIAAGGLPPNPGKLTVNPSGDTTPPAVPTGLHVVGSSPSGIELAWDAVSGDSTLYGYEVLRGNASGGPYATIALVTGTGYTDTAVAQDVTYYYVVRSVDQSFNRSDNSAEVQAKAELRTVTLNFTVTVPSSTDGTGRSVYIAGTLDRLDGNLPPWDPAGVVLTRVDATHWNIVLTGKESTQIEYKYALGDWNYVEKDGACAEIGNRALTLFYGTNGVQTVNDTVQNWRNVSPCGN